MTATWLDFCVRLDGPKEKQGYPGVPYGALEEKEGEVDHSTEGPLSAALGELNKLERQASWHFTVPKAGPPLQHYPLEAITWHAGLPGDRRQDTSLIGNLTLIGIEHVDWPDNVLNANQLLWSVELTKAFRRLCPRIAARPPALRINLFEHNWLSPTACPSGLILWAKKLIALQPVVSLWEDNDMMLLYHSVKGVYLFVNGYKRGLDGPTKDAYVSAGMPRSPALDAAIDAIPDEPTSPFIAVANASARATRDLFNVEPLK